MICPKPKIFLPAPSVWVRIGRKKKEKKIFLAAPKRGEKTRYGGILARLPYKRDSNRGKWGKNVGDPLKFFVK